MKYVKRKVINVIKLNDGFTYVELLLSLFVLSMILLITSPTLKLFQNLELKEPNFDVDIFIEDLYEIESSKKNFKIGNEKISFQSDSGVIEYRLSNNRIVKSIDQKGFIPLMYNVKSFNIEENKDVIHIFIEGDESYLIKIKK